MDLYQLVLLVLVPHQAQVVPQALVLQVVQVVALRVLHPVAQAVALVPLVVQRVARLAHHRVVLLAVQVLLVPAVLIAQAALVVRQAHHLKAL